MNELRLDLTDEAINPGRKTESGFIAPSLPWAGTQLVETPGGHPYHPFIEGIRELLLAHGKVTIVLTDAQYEELKHLILHGQKDWPPTLDPENEEDETIEIDLKPYEHHVLCSANPYSGRGSPGCSCAAEEEIEKCLTEQ